MQVTCERPPARPGGLVARLLGSFDPVGATVFWERTSQQVGPDVRWVVVDLSGVTMLTSAGLGILVRLFTRLQGHGGGLAIFGCGDKIREIIGIVMLTEILKVRDTEDQAWLALEAGRAR